VEIKVGARKIVSGVIIAGFTGMESFNLSFFYLFKFVLIDVEIVKNMIGYFL